jgi:hypothetical protein
MTKLYFATYNQQYDRDTGLDFGRFSYNWIDNEGNGATDLITVATMSTAGKQAANDFNRKGGMMPPQYRLPGWLGERTWQLDLREQNNSNLGGRCLQILPVYVTAESGVSRGEFFVHRNLNGVGSLGCTVTTAERLEQILAYAKKLVDQGVDKIPYLSLIHI